MCRPGRRQDFFWRYFSWQPPQLSLRRGPQVALKVSTSFTALCAALESLPNLASRASKSALFSQIVGNAAGLRTVREQRRRLRGRVGKGREDRMRLGEIERRFALGHGGAGFGLISVFLHERLAGGDRIGLRGNGSHGERHRGSGEQDAAHSVILPRWFVVQPTDNTAFFRLFRLCGNRVWKSTDHDFVKRK